MATDIRLVIRAEDRFAGVFGRLDEALRRTGEAGGGTERALAGVGTAMSGLAGDAARAEGVLQDFAVRTGQRMDGLAARLQARREAQAERQETFRRDLGERLLALDEAFARRRQALHERADARLAQSRGAAQQRLLEQRRAYGQAFVEVERGITRQLFELNEWFYQSITELARNQGRALTRLAKALATARALVDAYVAANNALASVPYPLNLPAAALVLAQGLANVERIRRVSVAHGGLERVPDDATFLLRRGERVLSADQNRDLTRFLARDAGGDGAGGPGAREGVVIENLSVHILENATSAESLLRMDAAALRQIVSERIIPALDELARLGIRPDFVESNT